jgi:hypothetical protein
MEDTWLCTDFPSEGCQHTHTHPKRTPRRCTHHAHAPTTPTPHRATPTPSCNRFVTKAIQKLLWRKLKALEVREMKLFGCESSRRWKSNLSSVSTCACMCSTCHTLTLACAIQSLHSGWLHRVSLSILWHYSPSLSLGIPLRFPSRG